MLQVNTRYKHFSFDSMDTRTTASHPTEAKEHEGHCPPESRQLLTKGKGRKLHPHSTPLRFAGSILRQTQPTATSQAH